MASGDTRKVILKNTDDEILIPYTEVASSTTVGRVKPDGTTTSVDSTGAMSVIGKQDTLVSGTNIKTINGTSVLGSGDLSVSAQVAKDNSTITNNSSNQLQAVATKNANTASGATDVIYDWVGTLAEYNAQAIATNHPDWVCYITDDNTNSAYQAYTTAETDALLATKANDSAAAHKAGAETFTGMKTVQAADDDGWVIKKANGDYTVAAPAVQVQGNFRVVDKNSKIIGDLRFVRGTNGTQQALLLARNAVTGTEVNCIIGCYVDKNGSVWTSAPTPATADNSTKIATTAFVVIKLGATFQVVTALPASPTAGVFYFVKE